MTKNEKLNMWRKTKAGVVSTIYNGQKYSSKKRGHTKPEYTQLELMNWLYSQEKFHILYNDWVNSNYDRMAKPSCDRNDNSEPYSIENISLMTWEDNESNGYKDMRSAVITHGNKPQVSVSFIKDGIETSFVSISEASRSTGILATSICNCLKGYTKTSGGCEWKYN